MKKVTTREYNKEVAVTDEINPIYYITLNPEPMDIIDGWQLSFLEGTILKYLVRWKSKNGITDLKKARWYLDRLISNTENGI